MTDLKTLRSVAPPWADLCLACDPFAGDFGEPGDRLLSDKIVKVRKVGVCQICEGDVAVGTFARRRSEIFDGELERFSFCESCCIAMADQDDEALNARQALGDERRLAALKDTPNDR